MKEIHADFIALRAAGLSYKKIANQLKVSKPTLIKWSRELSNQPKRIKTLQNTPNDIHQPSRHEQHIASQMDC